MIVLNGEVLDDEALWLGWYWGGYEWTLKDERDLDWELDHSANIVQPS